MALMAADVVTLWFLWKPHRVYILFATVRIDGHWGRWSDWTYCNVQCDDGKRTRFRKCDNPTPKHGGKYCVGDSEEDDVCTTRRCTLGEKLWF